ncbi:hypothetical protein [Novosphingobium sp. BW1]|uniref:hypothetical protein n=1 Tax=Novosphingobium sp. BW1 TaxID=2592621 RepID=UPI0011DEAC24|nr:hypothetical protein [Novosphingobium sp. BW1]TYC92056.1 hypothetical protein FMM79_03985 [Novosphingobium sp. BW1]
MPTLILPTPCASTTPRATTCCCATGSNAPPEAIDWLLETGWNCTPFETVFAPEHDLYTTPRTYRSTEQGLSLIKAYRIAIAPAIVAGILELFLKTRVEDVIDEDGVAKGVVATHKGKAVVLTTGGFAGSDELWQEVHSVVPLPYHIDTVVGDGLKLACKAGSTSRFADTLLPSFGGTRDLGAPARGLGPSLEELASRCSPDGCGPRSPHAGAMSRGPFGPMH